MYLSNAPAPHAPSGKSRTAAALLQRLRDGGAERRSCCAIYLHLSHLPLLAREPATMRLLRQALALQISDLDVTEYALDNRDLVLVGPADQPARYDAVVEHLRSVWGHDECRSGGVRASFYNLHTEVDRCDLIAAVFAGDTTGQAADVGRRRLTVAEVQAIDAKLTPATLADLLGVRTGVRIEGSRLTPIFEEICICREKLRRMFAPDADFGPRAPLARFLEAAADLRILNVIGRQERAAEALPLSLNLALETIATDAFAELERAAPPMPLLVEVPLIDVLAAPAAYRRTRARLADSEISLVIDGIGLTDLAHIDLLPLDPPMVKILWDEEKDTPPRPENERLLRRTAASLGPDRIIMADVDGETALTCALGCGIRQLQGDLIDRLVAAKGRRS